MIILFLNNSVVPPLSLVCLPVRLSVYQGIIICLMLTQAQSTLLLRCFCKTLQTARAVKVEAEPAVFHLPATISSLALTEPFLVQPALRVAPTF